jgi:uncharacterized protein (TIGR03435 family)
MNLIRTLAVAALAAAAAFAQSSPSRPEFEVSSIKPSAPWGTDHINFGIKIDGAQVHIGQTSLKEYVRMAYHVKDYEVEGPDWMAAARFDVDAKLSAGSTRDQVPEMLQSLLVDRFGLKAHRASKDLPVYGLVVGGDGLKMEESAPDPEGAPQCKNVDVKVAGGRGGVNVDYGCGSYFSFADDKLVGKKLGMTEFVDVLARFTDRPVVDMTGLKGRYDFVLQLSPEDYRAMLIRSALAAGVSLPPQALAALSATEDSLMMALRRLGLKLEPRKAPLEVVVVDAIRKEPTAN